MLNQRIDITEVKPPFLLSNSDNSWHIVISIHKLGADHYQLSCVEKQNNKFNQYTKTISESPFYVAEHIWELTYGSEIKTLLDDSLIDHPARKLWNEWNKHKKT